MLKKISTFEFIIAAAFLTLDIFLWWKLFFLRADPATMAEYFLDVGQGDSELAVFPGDIRILTDAGPGPAVQAALAEVLPPDDRYIDLAVVTHPDLDHFGGFQFLIDGGYRFGAFLYNGRDAETGSAAWPALIKRINNAGIPLVTVAAGDAVRMGAGTMSFLMPTQEFAQSASANDTSIVALLAVPGFHTLLAADMEFRGEDALLGASATRALLRADILKVGHHGSKYSSSENFLRAVDPKMIVIEVGARNTYRHPSREALQRIASGTDAQVLRTDRGGTITVSAKNNFLFIHRSRSTRDVYYGYEKK